MPRTYAVLYGMRGVKGGFRKVKTARVFAQKKADKIGKPVDIDRITTYPRAPRGGVDWSQRHHAVVKPRKITTGRKT